MAADLECFDLIDLRFDRLGLRFKHGIFTHVTSAHRMHGGLKFLLVGFFELFCWISFENIHNWPPDNVSTHYVTKRENIVSSVLTGGAKTNHHQSSFMSKTIDRLTRQLKSHTAGVLKDFAQISSTATKAQSSDRHSERQNLDGAVSEQIVLPDHYALDPEGQAAFDAIENNSPVVFVTGRAGTGKSTFIAFLKKTLQKNSVVLAPTGIAALNIGGQTIHSFFKFPPRMFENREIKSRNDTLINQLELIILDEISMVRADLLDHMDYALRQWRQRKEPFGGVQMLLVGDLLQLPPVIAGAKERTYYDRRYASPWFFSAAVFRNLPVFAVEMKQVHRQTEAHFIAILNRIRTNSDHRSSVAEINRTCFRDQSAGASQLTLTATHRQAQTINQSELQLLNTQSQEYNGTTRGHFADDEQRLPAPMHLNLKLGAQVMVTKNVAGAVNGTLARVISLNSHTIGISCLNDQTEVIVSREIWEQYTYHWDVIEQGIVAEVVGQYEQFPLTLGWAVTIHKCQGLTLESVTIDLGRGAFAPGQTYVALSRCRSLQGITLKKPIAMRDVVADATALKFYAALFDER